MNAVQQREGCSLYDAIGGLPALELTVQRFSKRVTADPELAALFGGMDQPKLKTQLAAFLGRALGAHVRYPGASRRRAETNLQIPRRQFDRFADQLADTLREVDVPDVLVYAVIERVWPLASRGAQFAAAGV